jgi:DUF2892 family protein
MRCNVGGEDRITRFVAGGTLLTMGLLSRGFARKLGIILGAIGIGTAASRFCPVNLLSRRNTCQLSTRISRVA